MQCISLDMGLSWSRFIWPKIETLYPPKLFSGMREVNESDLKNLPVFYAGILWSYCKVNDLFYENNKATLLHHNLWATKGSPSINAK